MIGSSVPHAMRAAMRKPFPAVLPDVTQLDFAALAVWSSECNQQMGLASKWTPARYRWRRAATRVGREYHARLLAHLGKVPGRCDQCQTQQPSMHIAYPPMEMPRFAHFCATCGPDMPPGWMCIAEFGTRTTSSAAR